MGTLQQLPDNILQRQVCQECYQYLSVSPIVINDRGETICGRCFEQSGDSLLEGGVYTKSTYNILAKRFLFKCTNHFNGCTEVLSLDGMKEHEEICSFKKKQECFFCSFSGNLSQIVNHSLIFHPDNVSFDGKFPFWLNDSTFKKNFILLVDDGIFYVAVDIADDLFTATISPATQTASLNEFGVTFFKPDDPLNFDFIRTDYSLLASNLVNCYEKIIGELVTSFGPGTQVYCQILVERFSMDVKEMEFQKRFAKLRQSEVQLNVQKQKLSRQNNLYTAAMNVIKKISYDLFKCNSCQKLSLNDTYYCLKMHCYCQNCVTNFCKACNTVREFEKLEDINNFMVSCDWPGCNFYLKIKDYLAHRSSCLKRSYKCPLQNCREVVFSSDNLIDHWHSETPKLVSDESIICDKYGVMEYYWFINYDLYRVFVYFSQSEIQVLIDEVNVLPHNISFKCTGITANGSQDLTSSIFCGRYNINIKNSIYFKNRGPCSCTQIIISTA